MKVELGLSIGYSGADKTETIEIDDSEVIGMSEEEIREYVSKNYLDDWKWNYIDTWVKIIELPKKDGEK